MKAGYLAELEARRAEFQTLKTLMEAIYMKLPANEDDIHKDEKLKGEIEKSLKDVDALTTTLVSTVKSVKLAVDSRLDYFFH